MEYSAGESYGIDRLDGVTRRQFLAAASMGLAALSAGRMASAAGPPRGNKPNVIYFYSDTHRWGAMSFTQESAVKTPTMEQMLSNGVSMDRCYVNLPICTPYRGILFSGRWPWQQGIMANHMILAERPDMPSGKKYRGTLGWMFKDAGYNTGYFGKSHWGTNDVRPYGFDKSTIGSGGDHTKITFTKDGVKQPTWRRGTSDDSNCTPVVTEALKWIDAQYDAPEPFFAVIAVHPPHGTMTDAPDGKLSLYPDETAMPYHPYDKRHEFRQHQGYHAHISDVDDEINRVLVKMNELGITNDTIFIYTSDHGGMSGVKDAGYGAKRYPEDESTRVPFLIQWPGKIPPHVRLNTLFSTIDHFPTLCKLANLPTHLAAAGTPDALESLDYLNASPGVDLSGNILGTGGPDPESVFIMHPSNMNKKSGPSGWVPVTRGVVTKEWTYAVGPEKEYCLYSNMGEYQYPDLLGEAGYDTIRHTLWKRIRDWMKIAEDPFIDAWFAKMPMSRVKAWNEEHGFGNVADREIGKAALFDIMKSEPSVDPKKYRT